MKLRHAVIGVALAAALSQGEISYSPVTTGATESAQKLYNFLATNYGSKTVSGVQTGDINTSGTLTAQADLQAVYTASGKYPALVGFDFLFATGKKAADAWYKQYTDKTIALATELWNSGGIPAFSWHWKDPSDSVDAFYTKGAGDPYTTFDFTKAFKTGTTDWDTTTETYKQMVSDIDEIAAYFKTLQDAGVAAIFRPMHECGGTFFWWSTKTGAQYAALYRLVYTRMTETNGIRNLVWVWNPQQDVFSQSDWNPGPANYDVVSVDIYNTPYNYQSNVAAFNEMKTSYGTDKIFALSENGPIPDASLMHADNAVWSWFMPWYESWDGKFVSRTKNTVWEANLATSCVYTLDKMPGWSNYTISTVKVAPCEVDYNLGDLDTAVDVQTVIPDTSNGNGWLNVTFDNMHTVTDGSGDTTLEAAAIIFIVPPVDLNGAKQASVTVYNTSLTGVWICPAFLTDETWLWQNATEGQWLNGGDSMLCTFDLSDLDLSNIAKFYMMIASEGYSGTLYFDNFTTDKGTIATFDKAGDLFTREQEGAEAYISSIAIIGGENEAAVKHFATPVLSHSPQIAVQGRTLLVSTAKTGNLTIDILDIHGRRITNLNSGSFAGGTRSCNLKNLARGLYIVRAGDSFGTVNRQIILQ